MRGQSEGRTVIIPDEGTAEQYRAAAHYCREEMRKAETRATELEKSNGELREQISQFMADRTNDHQQAELATLRAENTRLAASVTELSADGALLSMTHQRDQLRSEVARIALATEQARTKELSERVDWLEGQREIAVRQAEAALNESGECLAQLESEKAIRRELSEQVAALTNERDEAKSLLELAVYGVPGIAELVKERDKARSYAALGRPWPWDTTINLTPAHARGGEE